MNVEVKFGIRDDTQMLLIRTFSDTVVIEFGWWIYLNISQ